MKSQTWQLIPRGVGVSQNGTAGQFRPIYPRGPIGIDLIQPNRPAHGHLARIARAHANSRMCVIAVCIRSFPIALCRPFVVLRFKVISSDRAVCSNLITRLSERLNGSFGGRILRLPLSRDKCCDG